MAGHGEKNMKNTPITVGQRSPICWRIRQHMARQAASKARRGLFAVQVKDPHEETAEHRKVEVRASVMQTRRIQVVASRQAAQH